MKTILLLTFVALAPYSFSQVKLQSISEYSVYNTDYPVVVDSLSYIYNSNNGSLNSFQPEFVFSSDFADYYFYSATYFLFEPAENTNPDLFQVYFGDGTQSEFQFDINNTFTNGYITEANYPNFRYVYTRDINGNQLSRLKQEYNGAWTTIQSTIKTFDANNKTLTKHYYDTISGGQLALFFFDSITYDQVSGDVIQWRRFGEDVTGNGGLYNKTNFTYSGNELEFVDYYVYNNLGEEIWETRIVYAYSNGLPVTKSNYSVWNGVISTNPNIVNSYTYNGDGQLIEELESVNGEIMLKNELSYYNANFIKDKKLYSANAAGVLTHAITTNYYYSGILGIDQENLVSVSVFPNPTTDILTIQSDSPLTNLELRNLTGQIILEQQSNEVDLSHLPAGTYFIHGETEQGNFIEKVVKL